MGWIPRCPVVQHKISQAKGCFISSDGIFFPFWGYKSKNCIIIFRLTGKLGKCGGTEKFGECQGICQRSEGSSEYGEADDTSVNRSLCHCLYNKAIRKYTCTPLM